MGSRFREEPTDENIVNASKVRFKSPEARRLANSVIGQAASDMESAQRDMARAQKEQAKAEQAAAKAQAEAAEATRAMNVRAGAAQGMKTETDIATGKRSIALHPDGAPVFKAKPLGDPIEVGTQSTAVNVPGETQPTTRPFVNPLMAPTDGATGATGGTTKSIFAQPVRDDRGNVSMVQPDTTTDAKTGRQYSSKTDPMTGATVKTAVGIDQPAYDKIQREQQYKAKAQEIALRDNAVKQHKARFEPQFKPVADEFKAAKTEMEALPPVFVKEGGIWRYTDPKTLKQVTTYDPADVERNKALRAKTEERFSRAQQAFQKMEPTAANLDRNEKEIEAAKLKLSADKLRMESGLPEDDGGVAEILARVQSGEEVTQDEYEGALMNALDIDPRLWRFDGDSGQATARQYPEPPVVKDSLTTATPEPGTIIDERPLMPADPDKAAVVAEAFQGLVNPQEFTVGHTEEGYAFIKRNGEHVGRLVSEVGQKSLKRPVLVLNDNLNQNADIRQFIAFGGTKGLDVYLGSNARPDPVKEAEWTAGVFGSLRNAQEMGLPAPVIAGMLQEAGADQLSIFRKVKKGELSVQRGEAIMRDLYGTTLKADDPLVPGAIDKFMIEQAEPALRDEWAIAKGRNDTARMNEATKQYLNQWYVENQMKPGVNFQSRLLAEQALMKGQRIGEKAGAIGTGALNVAGSMVGMLAAVPMLGTLKAMQAMGDETAGEAADAAWQAYGRGSKNTWRGWDYNRKRWTTPDGKDRYKAFEAAGRDLQTKIRLRDSHAEGIDSPAWKADYAASVKAVEDAAMSLHELGQEKGWEITREDLERLSWMPNAYALTGDKSLLDAYFSALTEDHGTRQAADFQAELTAGLNPFMAGVIGGAHAPPEEIGVEIVSTLMTFGASKALLGGAKTAEAIKAAQQGTQAAGRLTKLRMAAHGLKDEFIALGTKADTLADPLTKGRKALNTTVQAGKVALGSGISEAGEEAAMGVAERDATAGSVAESAGIGFLAGFVMTPVMGGLAGPIEAAKQRSMREESARKFTEEYNKAGAGQEGFIPLSQKNALMAMSLSSPQQQAALQKDLSAAVQELAVTAQAASQDNASDEALNAFSRAQQRVILARDNLATFAAARAEAVQAVEAMPAELRPAYGAAMKVATGRIDLLTQAERAAAGGMRTESGQPFFTNVGGVDVLTDEARAEIAANAPSVGKLIETTESSAILAINEEAKIQAQMEAQAAAQPITPPVDASGAQGDPATGGVVPPHVSDASGEGVQFAGMEAAQYEAARAENPDMPEIGDTVAAAVAQGRPVSVSMAKAAGIEIPDGYARQGAMLVPPQAQTGTSTGPAENQATTGKTATETADKDKTRPANEKYGTSSKNSPQAKISTPPELMTATQFEQSGSDQAGIDVVKAAIAAGKPFSVAMGRDFLGITSAPQGYVQNGSVYEPMRNENVARIKLNEDQKKAGKAMAEQVKATIEARTPGIVVRIERLTPDRPTGGVQVNFDGSITLLSEDMVSETLKMGLKAPAAYFAELTIRHEVMHLAQIGVARDAHAKAGGKQSFGAFFQEYYETFFRDIEKDSPSALVIASRRYAQDTWINMPDWEKGAELFRMIGEDLISGESSEILEAINGKRPLEVIKAAIEYLTKLVLGQVEDITLSREAKRHALDLAERYSEMTGISLSVDAIAMRDQMNAEDAAQTTGPENGQNNGQATGQNSKESQQLQGKGADKTPDTTTNTTTAETPSQAIGKAIVRARAKYPAIAKDAAAFEGLLDLTDELAEVTAKMSPEERAAFIDSAFEEYAQGLTEAAQEEAQAEEAGKSDEKRQKARNARLERESRIRDKARQILNSGNYSALSSIFEKGQIQRKPNAIGLILARKRSGKKLTEREMELLRNLSEWDGAPTKSEWKGGGNNEVIRAILDYIYAKPGEGMMPDQIADGLIPGVDTSSEMFEAIDKELRALSRGESLIDPRSPDYEGDEEAIAKADAAAQAALEAEEAAQAPLPTLPEIITSLREAYGEDMDLAKKLELAQNVIAQLPEPMQTAITQAAMEEEQRIAYGVISAAKWQEMNPGLTDVAKWFQHLLDNASTDSIRATLNKLRNPKVQEEFARMTLASSPSANSGLSIREIQKAMAKYPGASLRENPITPSGTRYEPFRLRPEGVTLYLKSRSGALFPDGHEVTITQTAPRSIPDGGGAFWNRLRDGGRRSAIQDFAKASREDAKSVAWFTQKILKGEPEGIRNSPSEFWTWLRDKLNSRAFEGLLPEDTHDALAAIIGLESPVMESGSKDAWIYTPIDSKGTVLVSDVRNHRFEFGRLPTAAEMEDAKEASETGGYALFSSSSTGFFDFGATGEMGDKSQMGLNFDGPRAKAKANAQAAFDKLPEDSPGRARIAGDIARREGLADPEEFVKQATTQPAFGFNDTTAGTRDQLGLFSSSTVQSKSSFEREKKAILEGATRDVVGSLLAPNGKRTNLTDDQWATVRTKSFKNWFGDWERFATVPSGVWSDAEKSVSKVVDENGEPLVVYHGSTEAGFDPSKSDNRLRPDSVFFSSSRNTARTYSGSRNDVVFALDENGDFDAQSAIYAVFLNIRNPNEDNFEGANWDGTRTGFYEVRDADGEIIYSDEGRAYFADQADAEALAEMHEGAEVLPAEDHYSSTNSVAMEAKRYGNDGAIIREVVDDGGEGESYDTSDVFVAFKANQVKSAFENNGQFSDNPSILFSSPSQRAFDFGTTGSFSTRNQAGFDFSAPQDTAKPANPPQKATPTPEWVNFPASETLGIPRSEMPQVEAGNRSALVQFLKARGIDYAEAEILPGRLNPTQAEYSPAKVQKAREFEGGDRAILIDRNNRVVDGHHQWQAKLDKPTEPIRIIRFNARVQDLLPLIKEMPSTEVSGESANIAGDAARPRSSSATTATAQLWDWASDNFSSKPGAAQPNLFDNQPPTKETTPNDLPSRTNLEPDRPRAGTGDASRTDRVPVRPRTTGGTGRRVDESGEIGGDTGQGGPLSAAVPSAPTGNEGDAGIQGSASEPERGDTGDSGRSGRGEPDAGGVSPERPGRDDVRENLILSPSGGGTVARGRTAVARPQQSSRADGWVTPLTPDQQGDVVFAKRRLYEKGKAGVLLTNGTGTGKTFSGLGIVKDALDSGAKHILVVAPSDKVGSDWTATAQDFFDIPDIAQLQDTKDNGTGNRIAVTTYANLGQNDSLVNRPWDMIVTDEAHYLSQSKEGKSTNALERFRALTWHRQGLRERAEMMLYGSLRAELAAINAIPASKRTELQDTRRDAIYRIIDDNFKKLKEERKAMESTPKAVMLSATPFAYHFSLDYAEGYIFEHGPEPESKGYNTPSARDRFFVENFGYRMKYGKLTIPDAAAATATGILERRFAEKLMKEGAMSGRALKVDRDYSRQFALTESEIGSRIDEIMTFIQENERFHPLKEYIGLGNYLARRYLLEGIKARESVKRIKQHLALGRKVVVFHDYKKGGAMNPLTPAIYEGQKKEFRQEDGSMKEINLSALYEEMKRALPIYEPTRIQLNGLASPIDVFTREFPGIAEIFNGSVSKGKRRELVKRFNGSDSGLDILLVQRASGKEGISLHDIDGKRQRAFIDIGMPARPTDAIQGEGRIYRHGVKSDAVIEYLTTGTNVERWTFAQTIAQRSSTAENLAMGEAARALLQAYATGYNDAENFAPSMDQGKGGKEMDKAREESNPYQNAIALYFTNQKKTSRNKSAEGSDYFATPEPLGFKMVEWADIQPGEKVLEPSGGHGAIARFFPDSTNRHAVEASNELAGRLALNATDTAIHNMRFEDYNIANKFNAVVMNPPFGTAGKTAMDHLEKAAKHVRLGGRIVALIPEGSSMEKRFDKWYDEQYSAGQKAAADRKAELPGLFVLEGEIKLPAITFVNAGTKVSTRVVVLTRFKTPSEAGLRSNSFHDLSQIETTEQLFKELEFITVLQRPEKTEVSQDAEEADAAEAPQEVTTGAALIAGGRGAMLAKVPKPETQGTWASAEFNHTKTGNPIFVVRIMRNLSREEYLAAQAQAKALGGRYSSFRGAGAIPGFHFDSAEARDAFIGGGASESGMSLASSPSPQQPDLFAAATAPDASKKLGDVKVGNMNALGAYRSLTKKRAAGKPLSATEEQQLLDAEVALGQKLAFDMETLRGEAPPTTEDFSAVATPPPEALGGSLGGQSEMMMGGETERGGQMRLFSSPSAFSALRDTFENRLSKPPNQYQYETTDESSPYTRALLDILGAGRKAKIDEVRSSELSGQLGELEKATGTTVRFYKSSPEITVAGFTPVTRPDLIHINADRSDMPLSAIIAHEVMHIAQKDSQTDAQDVFRTIIEYLTEAEFASIENAILNEGYSYDDLIAEIPAFVMADAISGHDSIGLPRYARGEELRAVLKEWFYGLPVLKPDAKPGQKFANTFLASSPAAFREIPQIARNLSKPPNQYEYTETTDSRPEVLAYLRETGYQGHQPTSLLADTRAIEEISGASIVFVRGPERLNLGGNRTDHPRVVAINIDYPMASVGYGIVHELVHVAQKDSKTPSRMLLRVIRDMLSNEELKRINGYLDGYGYRGASPEMLASEFQAFLVADAVIGTNYIGLDNLRNAEPLRAILKGFFEGLPKLAPDNDITELFSTGISLASSPARWPSNLYAYTYRKEAQRGDVKHIVRTYNERTGLKEDRVFDTLAEAQAEMRDLEDKNRPITDPSEIAALLGLASAPTPEDMDAINQALSKMKPIFRAVFEAVNDGMKPEQVMAKFSLSEKAVTNILNAVRSRVVIATKARAGTLKAVKNEDGLFVNNRPDLAEGGKEPFVAVDQIRNESGVKPGERGYVTEERRQLAIRTLNADYEGNFTRLENMVRDGVMPDDLDVFMAQEIFEQEVMSGRINDPARATRVALFRVAYRDEGTAQSDAFRARIDRKMTPAQRNAVSYMELLYEPSPEVRARIKKAKGDKPTQDAILKQWMDKINAFKAEMKAEGYDIDASLAAFNERETARKAAEADNPATKAAVEQTFRKLSKIEKSVIEAIGQKMLLTKVMELTGLDAETILEINARFNANIREAIKDSVRKFMAASLASSPTGGDMISQILAEFGVWSNEMIDDRKPDFKDRREEALNPKPRKQPKPAKTEAEKMLGIGDKPLTDKQKAAIERFVNAPPSTWKAIRQETAALFPQSTGFPESYEEGENARRILSGLLLPDPINEETGTWDETRPFTGQGQLLRDPINETTGTFNMADPAPMAYLANEWASRNGSWINKLTEFYKMAILSGPQTMLVNASGGLFMAHDLTTKRAVEAAWNDLLGMFGAGDVRSATLSEFLPMVKHLRAAMKLAAGNALRSWKLQSPVFESYAEAKPIQTDFLGTGAEFAPPALETRSPAQFMANPKAKDINKVLNWLLRTITFRELTMVDEFWKGMYAQMDVAAISHRIAAKEEKLSGKAYADRVAELMQPGSKAWLRTINRTKRVTFQDELAYGKFTKEDERRNPNHKAGFPMSWEQALKKSETQSAWTLLDAVAAKAMDARKTPFLGPLMHMFALPFIITPKNIIQRGLEVTPLGLVVDVIDGMRSLRRRVISGQITKEESNRIAGELYNKARFVQTLTNQSLGLMIYFAAEALSDDDDEDEYGRPIITGTLPWSATKKGERDTAMAVMPPQSIRIGNTIIPYGRIEPFATAISALVDMALSSRRNGDSFNSQVLTDTVVGFKSQFQDKLFLKGLGDLLRVAEDPRRGADRLAASWITGFVPNLVRQPIRELDPVVRDKNPQANDGILTAIGKRVGYELVPQSAPPKMSVWGEEIASAPGAPLAGSEIVDSIFRVFDPLNMRFGTEAKPIDAWIYRYNHLQPTSSERIGIEVPDDEITITIPGQKPQKIALTEAEKMQRIRNVGKAAEAFLSQLDWDAKTATDSDAEQKAKLITDTFTRLKADETERIKLEKLAAMPGGE